MPSTPPTSSSEAVTERVEPLSVWKDRAPPSMRTLTRPLPKALAKESFNAAAKASAVWVPLASSPATAFTSGSVMVWLLPSRVTVRVLPERYSYVGFLVTAPLSRLSLKVPDWASMASSGLKIMSLRLPDTSARETWLPAVDLS